MTYPAYEYPRDYQPPVGALPPVLQHPEPKKNRPLLWVLVGLAVVVLAVGAGLGALILAKDKVVTVSVEQQVHDWRAAASSDFMAVGATMNQISAAANNEDLSAVMSACVILENDVRKARKNLSAPDEDLTREITSALDDYDNAAVTCQHIDSGADVSAAGRYLAAGNAHIQSAGQIMDEAEAKLKEGS